MIRHVVMFKWNDDVDEAHIRAVAAGLDRLVDTVPTIRGYTHGADVGVNAGNHDYVVVGDFDSVDDYIAYRDHPEHQAFLAGHIAGRVASRAAVQYHHDG